MDQKVARQSIWMYLISRYNNYVIQTKELYIYIRTNWSAFTSFRNIIFRWKDGLILSYPHRWRVVWYSDRMSQVSTHLEGLSRGKTKRWHESPISPSWTIEHWIFQFLILRGLTNHIRSVQTWDPVPGRSTHPQPVVCHTVVATTEASKSLCKELLKLRRSALRQWGTDQCISPSDPSSRFFPSSFLVPFFFGQTDFPSGRSFVSVDRDRHSYFHSSRRYETSKRVFYH